MGRISKNLLSRSLKCAAYLRFGMLAIFLFCFCPASPGAPKLALVPAGQNEQAAKVIGHIGEFLEGKFEITDAGQMKAALNASAYQNLSNLSREEARNIGNAIGCDYFLILKSETLSRSASNRPLYYESYAAAYLAASKDGRLLLWRLKKNESDKAESAENGLLSEIKILASEITTQILAASKPERQFSRAAIESLPDEGSPGAADFRPPQPYKRIKPPYPSSAALYLVEATIDAEVDISEKGEVAAIEIIRWGGFGLDEAVAETIRKMNWRPALKNGKALPVRVLLRYNFKKPKDAKDEG